MVLLCCGYSEAVGNRVGKHGCIYSVLVFTVIRKYGRRSLELILKSCLSFNFLYSTWGWWWWLSSVFVVGDSSDGCVERNVVGVLLVMVVKVLKLAAVVLLFIAVCHSDDNILRARHYAYLV